MGFLAWWLFVGEPAQVRQVRDCVRETLGGWCPRVADAEAVACELAVNAVQYTPSGQPGGKFAVGIDREPASVVLRVRDAGGETVPHIVSTPAPGRGDEPEMHLTDHGRGLLLVDALSDAWGYVDIPSGRSVWAAFTTPDGSHDTRDATAPAQPEKDRNP